MPKYDNVKTLKGRRVFVIYIDCERVNIPDKLPHSKRHVIQSSFSFSFNNQRIKKKSLHTCFIDVLQKLPSTQIKLYCLSAEISKQQRYRSILHV